MKVYGSKGEVKEEERMGLGMEGLDDQSISCPSCHAVIPIYPLF